MIQRRRRELKLEQRDVAQAVEVERSSVSGWESGRRPVPLRHLGGLAKVLQIEEARLVELAQWEAPRLRKTVTWRRRYLRLAEPHGTREEMLAMHPQMRALRNTAIHRGLTSELEREILRCFPRESPLELGLIYLLLAMGATLSYASPLAAGCQQFIADHDDFRYTGHLLRPVLVLDDLLFFGQVSIAVLSQSRRRRVDFLVKVVRPGDGWSFSRGDCQRGCPAHLGAAVASDYVHAVSATAGRLPRLAPRRDRSPRVVAQAAPQANLRRWCAGSPAGQPEALVRRQPRTPT
ncbi:MAG: helix-turn-helix domain-containing protein [Candidatus Xenobia bacterium]